MSNECSPGSVAARPQATVLVVEDDPSVRQMLQWTLEEEGLLVGIAADGQQALQWLARQKPDLVLLDMGLPVLDGDSVARHVRERFDGTVPIVVVTADGRAAAKAACAGAVDYLQKPFNIDVLVQCIRRVLDPTARQE